MPFEGFDFTGFWDECSYAQEYRSQPPSGQLIAEIEQELGYKLPQSYIWLMKQHNGGIPVNCCAPCEEGTSWAEDHAAISGIFGIGREKSYSLCGSLGSRFMIEEWGYPDIGVAICDCPSAGHDMIFLDYRECGPQGEPKVVHIDQEGDYEITPLADNFEEFIRGLVHEEEYDDSEEERAADLERVQSAPFGELLAELVSVMDKPAVTEAWIRHISREIVEEKGFFALHADEKSYLLYDIQLWLYLHATPATTEEQYKEAYEQIIALAKPFGTFGYASGFIDGWLLARKESGGITVQDGVLVFTDKAKAALLQQREQFEREYMQ